MLGAVRLRFHSVVQDFELSAVRQNNISGPELMSRLEHLFSLTKCYD
jgi:hypothetical protein